MVRADLEAAKGMSQRGQLLAPASARAPAQASIASASADLTAATKGPANPIAAAAAWSQLGSGSLFIP